MAGGVATMQPIIHACSTECVKRFACTYTKLTTNSKQTLAPTIAYITLVIQLISVNYIKVIVVVLSISNHKWMVSRNNLTSRH